MSDNTKLLGGELASVVLNKP